FVTPNGPSARAGLVGGEKILAIDDQPVTEPDDLFLNVAAGLAGSEIRVQVESNGRPRTLRATLVKAYWPPSGPVIAANRPRPVQGITVDYTSALLRGLVGDNTGILPGVAVRDVEPGSAAAKAGLKPDSDIITEVNGRAVNTPKEFYAAANSAGPLELTLAEPVRKVKLP
ncbi:MAG: PDZ domain-containing protein, partial [Gemmataceae bacterium]